VSLTLRETKRQKTLTHSVAGWSAFNRAAADCIRETPGFRAGRSSY